MEEVLFCSFCGRSLEHDYRFCPYCGSACRDAPSIEQVIHNSLNRMEESRMTHGLIRLERLSSTLNRLEDDLTLFLACRGFSGGAD